MSDVAFASDLVRGVVTTDAGATIGARIRAASRRLGWSYGRTKAVWYGEARRIDGHELDALRAAKRARDEAELNDEIRDLRKRVALLETTLALARPQGPGASADEMRARLHRGG